MKLLYLHFAVKIYEWLQQRRVRRQFYQNATYKKLDEELLSGPNPYRIKEAFPYGETPLCSLKQIADRCHLTAADCVIDLGCGRGRSLFFLAEHYGCRALGIDKIQPFIERAQSLVNKYRITRVSLTCGDLFHCDLSEATCIFFYGTTFDELSVAHLTHRLLALKPGTKIVTVSYPLQRLTLLDKFTVSFPWGRGEVYIGCVA